MLDKKMEAVLQALLNLAGNSYKVLNKQGILQSLPRKLNIDSNTLGAIFSFLSENDFIDVKYQDKDEICLCTTIKAESYVTGDKMQQRASLSTKQNVWLTAGMFISSFLGAFVAILIAKLLGL
ncbi:MAG: hypothetical protein IJ492_05375 [Clostridia bacterium]|nr:hypothetical protein [Clostridia bacterium]MBQ7915022.1 hypothetical protein [Clostridia bacterium]MBQ8505680.1 hypothetical protein [Clostridia bacterium]MBQ8772371.1 hypothetical protein [Clostridia bacterium]MBQ8872534.1 hypothetical protein [Clostridia bacterium]